jgi:hypothetical protein
LCSFGVGSAVVVCGSPRILRFSRKRVDISACAS